jgi:hypothetical protein
LVSLMKHSPFARIAPSSLHRPRIPARGPLALRSSLGRIGTTLAGGSLDPALLAQPGWHASDLGMVGVHVLLARTLVTGLLAPVLCSLQMVLWRHQASGGWRR